MNQSLILKIVGVILCIEALCMAPSLLLSIACGGVDQRAFLYALLICGGVGVLLSLIRARNTRLQTRDGFVCVALCWIVLSVFGALPYFLSGSCGFVDAACRRACAAAEEHHQNEDTTAELRPEVKILRTVAGGGDERNDLKRGVLDRRTDAAPRAHDKIRRDQRRRTEHHKGVNAQFLAADRLAEAARCDEVEQRKVHRRRKHEENDDPVDE